MSSYRGKVKMRIRKHMIGNVIALISAVLASSLMANEVHEFASGKAGASPQQPQVAVAPNGSIYLVYGSENSVYCAVSRDRGKSFLPPVLVADEGPLSLGMHR